MYNYCTSSFFRRFVVFYLCTISIGERDNYDSFSWLPIVANFHFISYQLRTQCVRNYPIILDISIATTLRSQLSSQSYYFRPSFFQVSISSKVISVSIFLRSSRLFSAFCRIIFRHFGEFFLGVL